MSAAVLGVAIPVALGSAVCFGYASAVQHDETGNVARRSALDPGLLAELARRGRWWFGIVADVVAIALQALALRFGPVSLVQPLLVAGLPAAVLLSAAIARRRPEREVVGGVAVCAIGIALVAGVTRDVPVSDDPRSVPSAVAAVATTTALLLLLAVARRWPRRAGPATGAAAGLATGAASVLLALCVARIDDPLRLLGSVVPYATAAVSLLALLLTQAAFQTGSLPAPLAALSLLEPLSGVALAAVVLGERPPLSAPTLIAGLVGTACAVVGVLVLAARAEDAAPHTSPALATGPRPSVTPSEDRT